MSQPLITKGSIMESKVLNKEKEGKRNRRRKRKWKSDRSMTQEKQLWKKRSAKYSSLKSKKKQEALLK